MKLINSHHPMPVFGYWDRKAHCSVKGFTVPWAMLVPHNEQAKKNHRGQDLQRLYDRFGMGAEEVLAVLDDRPLTTIMDEGAAHAELRRRVDAFNVDASISLEDHNAKG